MKGQASRTGAGDDVGERGMGSDAEFKETEQKSKGKDTSGWGGDIDVS